MMTAPMVMNMERYAPPKASDSRESIASVSRM